MSGQDPDGTWQGVAPDLARAVAARLGTDVAFVPYDSPGPLADAADTGAWSIGMIGAEPARAERIRFSPAYVEIEATYLVPPDSALRHADDVDRPGNRISVFARSAYDLYLTRNLKHAHLVRADSFAAAFAAFRNDGLEALACLTPKLVDDAPTWPGSRILDGRFMAIQQAVGTSRANPEAADFLERFVEEAKASGLVARWIADRHIRGLSVAPLTAIP